MVLNKNDSAKLVKNIEHKSIGQEIIFTHKNNNLIDKRR